MDLTLEKLADLEYDDIITLGVIESDADLTAIFTDEVKLSFNLLRSIASQGKLNDDTRELLLAIFNGVILTKQEYVNKYIQLSSGVDITPKIAIPDPVIVPLPIMEKLTKVNLKEKKEKLIPRRYGKEKILADVKEQNGVATPVQRAMLKVNDLKNIYVNLSARGIKDMVGGTNLLSDTDCRDIVSAITIAERKLAEILKKK